jgi:hypothetical protein
LGCQQRRCILQACVSSTKLSLTDFIARYQYGIVTDRALISNRLYKAVTDRFNICNGLFLTSVTKNLCDRRLRSPLPEVHIGNGRCGGQPPGRPGVLIDNGCQITTIKMWVDVTGVKCPLQMLRDLFEFSGSVHKIVTSLRVVTVLEGYQRFLWFLHGT